MRHLIAILLALPLTIASVVRADTPASPATRVRARCAALGVDDETARSLLRPVESAVAAGLPERSVADKVLEGLAKGIEPTRIVAAAEAVARRLGEAHAILQEAGVRMPAPERPTQLERLALAMQPLAGEEARALARASRGSPADRLVTAMRQLARLRARGETSPEAIAALGALARAAHPPEELGRVTALYDAFRAQGGDPARFFEAVRARAESRRSLGVLVERSGERPDSLDRPGSGRELGPVPEPAPDGRRARD